MFTVTYEDLGEVDAIVRPGGNGAEIVLSHRCDSERGEPVSEIDRARISETVSKNCHRTFGAIAEILVGHLQYAAENPGSLVTFDDVFLVVDGEGLRLDGLERALNLLHQSGSLELEPVA